MPLKYMLIENNAYMGYCLNRYFDTYDEAYKEFEELKRLNLSCTLIAFNFIDHYQESYC